MNPAFKFKEDRQIDTIHLEEIYEVKAWCHMFEITASDLKHAVEVVGTSAVKVKEYIASHRVNA
jgi:hypothetical protein